MLEEMLKNTIEIISQPVQLDSKDFIIGTLSIFGGTYFLQEYNSIRDFIGEHTGIELPYISFLKKFK